MENMTSLDSSTSTDCSCNSSAVFEDTGGWPTLLQCYICHDLYKKPRILPCGHTFCGSCLIHLRDVATKEFHTSNPLCHRRGESGIFTCPMPDCNYSMKSMNLCRWSLKNRLASDATRQLLKSIQCRREETTQTYSSLAETILTLPQILMTSSESSFAEPGKKDPTFLDMLAQAYFSADLSTSIRIPGSVHGWRTLVSYGCLSLFCEVLQ